MGILLLFFLASGAGGDGNYNGILLSPKYDPQAFYIRGRPGDAWQKTYSGAEYKRQAQGKLMNLRLAQALYHDEWLTGVPFDPDANTNAAIAALDFYKAHGILMINVSLQGGQAGYDRQIYGQDRQNGFRYGRANGTHVSAFRADGSLKPEWLGRLDRLVMADDPKLDSTVRSEVARLRARLSKYYSTEGSQSLLVIELPKGGYVPSFRQPEPAPGAQRARPRRLGLAACLAGFVVAATGLGVWWVVHKNAPIPIAVLPLMNLSQDPANDYLADGLTSEIISELSLIEGLTVRSQTSSFALRGKPRNVHEAGSQLAADYIVEGSVVRSGQQLRIDTRLVRTRDDVPIWTEKFEREWTEVPAIQDEISRGSRPGLAKTRAQRSRLLLPNHPQGFTEPGFAHMLGVKGQIAAEQLIQDHPQRIDVRSGFEPAIRQVCLFGAHVLRRTKNLPGFGARALSAAASVNCLRDAEIDNLGRRLSFSLSCEDVRRLQIAMQDTLVVGIVNGAADRDKKAQPLRDGQGMQIAVFGDRQPIDKIHHEIRAARAGHPGVNQPGNMRMVQQRQGTLLGFVSRESSTVDLPMLDDFERDFTPNGLKLLGQVHNADSTLADLAQDFVRPETLACRWALGGKYFLKSASIAKLACCLSLRRGASGACGHL